VNDAICVSLCNIVQDLVIMVPFIKGTNVTTTSYLLFHTACVVIYFVTSLSQQWRLAALSAVETASNASPKSTQAPHAVLPAATAAQDLAVHRGCGVTWVAPSAEQTIALTTPGVTCWKMLVPLVLSLRQNFLELVT